MTAAEVLLRVVLKMAWLIVPMMVSVGIVPLLLERELEKEDSRA